jgi:antitoxin (DNA-binding transcriptional repressor) of toxin-antitoxin stability system
VPFDLRLKNEYHLNTETVTKWIQIEVAMKFLPVREIRTQYNKVMEQLRKEKKIVLTNKGKPVALLTEMNEDNFEERISQSKSAGFASETSAAYSVDHPEILKAWIEEAERRQQDYLDGKVKLTPAFAAIEKIRKKYKK